VLRLCDRIAVLNAGIIAESLPVSQLAEARHKATLSLLSALPVPVDILLGFRK
jgi:ABC-type dipeptide/oligopeptide/nickel transport system ATPase component